MTMHLHSYQLNDTSEETEVAGDGGRTPAPSLVFSSLYAFVVTFGRFPRNGSST